MTSLTLQGLDLSTICDVLGSIKTKWFEMGVRLGIPRSKLLEFKGDPDPLSAVVDYWLKENVPESVSTRSWDSIVTVLKSEYVGEPGLAEKISQKYCQPQETTDDGKDPNHSNEKRHSPPTPSDTMDPDIKMDLEFILERNLKQIIAKYASYVDCIRTKILEKEVSPDGLRYYLLSLSATSKSEKGQQLTLLSDKKKELEKCSTITGIFTLLTTECASFLNYDVFVFLLEHYEINEEVEKLRYPDHLKTYIRKHKVSEFAKINPLLKSRSGSKELTLKFDIETACSLAKVIELKKLIAEIMDLSPSALEIVDIEDGCVVVTFLIPASVADALFTPDTVFTPQQVKELQATAVVWLKCNGQSFHFRRPILQTDNSAFRRLEEQLTCCICLGTYSNPKQLQCHHVYCQECLIKLVSQDRKGRLSLTCPTCRQVTSVPRSGVTGLQTDFQINTFLEIMKEHKVAMNSTSNASSTSNGVSIACASHGGREVELYCNTCKETICYKCISRDEKHHSHEYDALGRAVTREITKPLEEQLLAIKDSLVELDACSDEISGQRAAIENDIHNTFTNLQELLEVRKSELIGQLDQLAHAKLNSLAGQRERNKTAQAQLSSCLQFMRENLKTGRQGEVLLMKSTTVKQVKELTSTFKPDMLEPNTEADLMFESLDFTAECQNYGKVYATGSPDPSKCFVTGMREKTVLVGEVSFASLQFRTMDFDGLPRKVSMAAVTCELVSDITGVRTTGNMERKGLGRYEISYTPTVKGRHQLHIQVEGQHVRGSPLVVSARPQFPEEKFSTPLSCINEVDAPVGVAVNQVGEVIVTLGIDHSVAIFSLSGRKILSFGWYGSDEGEFNHPCGVAVEREENSIFIADSANHRIQKFTADGEFLAMAGTLGKGPLQFNFPRGIAINTSNDMLYIADEGNNRIQILDSNLCFSGAWRGAGDFSSPQNIACDSSGNVYISDGGNYCIQVFTAEGKFLRKFGRHGGELIEPYGLAVCLDRVYVSDVDNDHISVFNLKGELVTSRKRSDEFQHPCGLATDTSGVLYVCEWWNNRIQLF